MRLGSLIRGITHDASVIKIALVTRNIAVTRDFMLGGARAYASSYPVTFTNISEMAPRQILGNCHQMEIGETSGQVDAWKEHGDVS